MRLRLAIGVLAVLVAAGCSKDKDIEPPAKLVDFPQTLPVHKLWSTSVGGGKKQMLLRLGLGPTLDKGTVFAASDKGEVLAVALDSGRTLWRKALKLPLSAGPVAASGVVVVGSIKGNVIALDESSGKELWRARVNSELLSAPAIGERVVALRSVDGRLRGLDIHSGKELWSVEQQVPRLSLRGTATPVVAGEDVICGFDNGKIMSVSLVNGDTVWDTALSSPHGRTELERLVDVDSAVRVVDDNVYAVGFQGRVAMLALDSGQIWWAHDMSSNRGLAVDDQAVYVAQADGELVALRQRDGSELWHNSQVRRRSLSTPAITSTAVVVADYQGFVHWFDKKTGKLVARERVAKYRVTNAPVADGDTVVVMTDAGDLAAYRAGTPAPAAAPAPAPATAPAPTQP
jgi:outer membrane protein assembly factor BamB